MTRVYIAVEFRPGQRRTLITTTRRGAVAGDAVKVADRGGSGAWQRAIVDGSGR